MNRLAGSRDSASRRTADESFVVGAIAEAFDAVPDGSSYCLWIAGLAADSVKVFKEMRVRTPMLNAPPKSDNATHGHGSREWSRPWPSWDMMGMCGQKKVRNAAQGRGGVRQTAAKCYASWRSNKTRLAMASYAVLQQDKFVVMDFIIHAPPELAVFRVTGR